MKKIEITSAEVFEFQKTTWRSYTSQDGVHLEVNLLGHWRVKNGAEIKNFDDLGFSEASNFYIETLEKQIPWYKIAVEFV